MMGVNTFLLLLFVFFTSTLASSNFYPTSITDVTGTHSPQALTVLQTKDQTGTANNWAKYIEFDSTATIYSGIFTFDIGNVAVSGLTLSVNFQGQAGAYQLWVFEVYLNAVGTTGASWVQIGDTSADTKGWAAWTLLTFTPSVDFTRVLNSQKQIQIRFRSLQALDNADVDFVQLTLTTSTSATTAPVAPAATTVPTAPAATTVPTSAGSVPTTAPTVAKATSAPVAPTTPAGAKTVNLKLLILATKAASIGVDFAILACNSTGVVYDFVAITTTTSLATYLSTSTSAGAYSGIISATALSAAQKASVVAYQVAFGVKWVVLNASPAGITGLSAGAAITTAGTLTLAPQFAKFSSPLQSNIQIDTKTTIMWSGYDVATVNPAIITDTTVATPAIMIQVGTAAKQVAAAQIKNSDGTLVLYYFIQQAADFFHSRAFAPLMINWVSPGMIYQGARRLTFTLQADDLLMASNLWDTKTHKNPLSDKLIYRMTDVDLQALADYYDAVNPTLPAGSYITVEWPFNGAGSLWYMTPDTLLAKAIQLQDKFWFISHTWDHPCDLDTGTYAEMNSELVQNIQFTPTLLTNGGLASPRFSNDSLINPCITGIANGKVLSAMADLGIVNCVGDNSVKKYTPANPYHGLPTNLAVNGYVGVFIVPREDLDMDYDVTLPAEVVDEYNTVYGTKLTFEEIMDIQTIYSVGDKLAFRHDPFMMHQANGRSFSYADPVTGTTHTVSLISLFTDRSVKKMMTYYNLPITAPKMSDLAELWKRRLAADTCGFKATLNLSGGLVYSITVSSVSDCVVPVSGVTLAAGPTVRLENVGQEKTAYITLKAGVTQTLSLAQPVSL